MSSEPRKNTIFPSAKRHQCCMCIAARLARGVHRVRPVEGDDHVGLVGRDRQEVELGDVDVRADLLEEPGNLALAPVAAVPRHRRAGGLRGPVDVVGQLGQDGVDVASAVRRVQALDRFDLRIGRGMLGVVHATRWCRRWARRPHRENTPSTVAGVAGDVTQVEIAALLAVAQDHAFGQPPGSQLRAARARPAPRDGRRGRLRPNARPPGGPRRCASSAAPVTPSRWRWCSATRSSCEPGRCRSTSPTRSTSCA